MGRLKKIKILDVYLNNIFLGILKKDNTGKITFQYSQEWIEEGFAISNSLPLQESEFKGEVVSRYFDNLLPDNEEIKNAVATKYGAQSTRSFDMLEVIGRDCVGALSFLPEGFAPSDNFSLNYLPIKNSEIAKRLKGLSSTNPLGMDQNDFRISIAGAQEKTAFLKIDNKWFEPIGLTPTTHIFKNTIGAMGLELNFQDSVDNEYFSLEILKNFGLNVCNVNIETFEDQKVLVVERFDRKWVKKGKKNYLLRVPQEDFCQALKYSPYQKYQSSGGPGIVQISKLLNASTNPEDKYDFFKAIILFDLLYATDGHAKNFSIFHKKSGFQLTPFYDVMSGYFLHKREKFPIEKLKLAMKVGDSGHYAFKRVTMKHYIQSAKSCGISQTKCEEIIEDIKTTHSKLNITPVKNLDQNCAQMILEGMNKRIKIF